MNTSRSPRRAAGAPSVLFQPSYFKVKVRLDATGEVFPYKVYSERRILEVKADLEFLTGIPLHLQRLWYLDEADLQDDEDIRHYAIVPDGLLHVSVHYTWAPLVQAVSAGNLEDVLALGVTSDSAYTSPNLDYQSSRTDKNARAKCLQDRAWVALFIASHQGHLTLCKLLVASGARVTRVTSCGRSALHIAAARGHGDVMDLLLERGAKADATDKFGDTPSTVAIRFGHKECDRHLFMFRWQQRAKRARAKKTS